MLLKLYRRLINFNNRRRNARLLGIHFWRPGDWELPNSIQIGHHTISLNLLADSSTKTAFIDILLDDCYGLTYFKKMLPGLNNIIDVGANQGLFVLHARNLFPGASIDAYEPNEIVIPTLSHHAKATNARVFHEAVGLNGGMISMQHGQDSLHGKTLSNETGDIIQTSIRECLNRLPASTTLLKLDCEGAEWEIIKDREAMKRVNALTLEYHLDEEHLKDHHNRPETISGILVNLGFKIIRYTKSSEDFGIAWAIREDPPA